MQQTNLFYLSKNMVRVALLNGKNRNHDHDVSKIIETLANEWVVTWLNVSVWEVQPWYWFVRVERFGWQDFLCLVEINESTAIDVTWTKKVRIEIDQSKVNDWSGNSLDGTGIASIQTWATYPSSSVPHMKLASIASGTVTDERTMLSPKISVSKTWDETVWWIKTFSSSPIVPTPTWSWDAVNKWALDSAIAQASSISQLKKSLTLWEDISAWKPYFRWAASEELTNDFAYPAVENVAESNLLAYYSLDDATDSHTNSYDGTQSWWSFVTWKIGNWYSMSWAQSISLDSRLNSMSASSFSFSFWVKFDSFSWDYIIKQSNFSTSWWRALLLSARKLTFILEWASTRTLYWTTVLSTWVRYHVVVVRDVVAWTRRIYLDWSLEAFLSSWDTFTSTLSVPVTIGSTTSASANCTIDEVSFYNKALTYWEVSSLYNWWSGRAYQWVSYVWSINVWDLKLEENIVIEWGTYGYVQYVNVTMTEVWSPWALNYEVNWVAQWVLSTGTTKIQIWSRNAEIKFIASAIDATDYVTINIDSTVNGFEIDKAYQSILWDQDKSHFDGILSTWWVIWDEVIWVEWWLYNLNNTSLDWKIYVDWSWNLTTTLSSLYAWYSRLWLIDVKRFYHWPSYVTQTLFGWDILLYSILPYVGWSWDTFVTRRSININAFWLSWDIRFEVDLYINRWSWWATMQILVDGNVEYTSAVSTTSSTSLSWTISIPWTCLVEIQTKWTSVSDVSWVNNLYLYYWVQVWWLITAT